MSRALSTAQGNTGTRTAALLLAVTASCAPLPRPPERGALRVMSYNIQSGAGDLRAVAEAIRAADVDVAALQEVDRYWSARSGFMDQPRALGDLLGMHVCYAPIYSLAPAASGEPPREFGVLMLSRLRVISCENTLLTRLSTQDPHPVPTPMTGLLDAVVDVRGVPVRVLVAHLDYRADPRVRARQVAELLERLAGAGAGGAAAAVGERAADRAPIATLLAGDLNATPDAPELQPLFARLTDGWSSAAGPGFTYPADAPAKRIDYVLLAGGATAQGAQVLPVRAADHRPVVVDLLLTPH